MIEGERLTEPAPDRARFQQVAQGVLRLVANNPGSMTFHGTNSYIVEDGRQCIVIDPGPAEDESHIERLCGAIDGRAAAILVSHYHKDHSGALAQLRDRTGAPVHAFCPSPGNRFPIDVKVRDGDRIGPLTVLHTPGHSSDHLCFARDDGVLFTGDHVMSWSSTMVKLPDGDMRDYCSQLERLIARDDTLYLAGHGPALAEPRTYVRRLLASRMRREHMIWDALHTKPATTGELVRLLYAHSDGQIAWAAEQMVEAHLAKLAFERRAVSRDGLWHAS